jgi:hypothetical protein
MLITTEAQLVDALNKMHDQAVALKFTINGIVAYLKQIDALADVEEYETHAAYAGDMAADALVFMQFIENRD